MPRGAEILREIQLLCTVTLFYNCSMYNRIITGVDVGTYQVKVMTVKVSGRKGSKSKPQIIGTGYAESRGLRHGYIINDADVTRSVRNAVAQAEKGSQIRIKRVFVSVGGSGLDEVHARGETITSRSDSQITQPDVDKAIEDAEEKIATSIPNRKIIHRIPLRYYIDGERVLGKPHGLVGTKLETDVFFIVTFTQHVEDLVKSIENAGVIVEDTLVASPLAGSLVMLNNTQKRAGCVLANIGAETVSILVYEDDLPISLKVFPVGSNDITNGIALGLKIPIDEAEKIKHGKAIGIGYPKRTIDEIISNHLNKIFILIDDHLKKIERDGLLPAGIIMTGGGSGLATAKDLARASLRLPSKIGQLDLEHGGKIRNSSWAVAYGLCRWGAPNSVRVDDITSNRQTGIYAVNWLRQFLP